MRMTVKYTNIRGESIVFNQSGSSFHANKFNGLGDVGAEIQTQKSPYQDGSSFVDGILLERAITFEVYIKGTDITDISNKRSYLARILNPKLGEGTLEVTYGNVTRIINAVADGVPVYPSGFENRGRRHQIGLVNLICPNPYWRTTSISEEPMFTPLFQFPFERVFEMGLQQDQRIIYYDGDAPSPLQIEFYGPATNPKIINNTTGEFIKINQVLLEGERMMIDTTDGNKSVYFVDELGNERNVFNWIDLNSTFFKLQIGANEIQYTADSNIQGTKVNISYSKLYTAI